MTVRTSAPGALGCDIARGNTARGDTALESDAGEAALSVPRTGIRFHNLTPERVQIEIAVENRGSERSAPTELRLEAAPFGAFVRWQPLATLDVPPIRAGGSVILRTTAEQPRPQPVTSSSGLLPPSLPSASAAGMDPRAIGARAWTLILGSLTRTPFAPGKLPPSVLDLLDGARPHWAGNLNVWIGKQAVERHAAPRLRIFPGRANLSIFCLGHEPDGYAFSVQGLGEDWRCELLDLLSGRAVEWEREPWSEPQWLSTQNTRPILFVVRPPLGCARGNTAVHVTQRSSGKSALVEFDLDPGAQGTGCYSV